MFYYFQGFSCFIIFKAFRVLLFSRLFVFYYLFESYCHHCAYYSFSECSLDVDFTRADFGRYKVEVFTSNI